FTDKEHYFASASADISQDGGAQDDRKSLDFCLDTLAYLAIGLRFDGCGDGNAVGAPVR
ncbi:hypothetical protein BgiBS90_015105, partial [Biomphalaria glabrata]